MIALGTASEQGLGGSVLQSERLAQQCVAIPLPWKVALEIACLCHVLIITTFRVLSLGGAHYLLANLGGGYHWR